MAAEMYKIAVPNVLQVRLEVLAYWWIQTYLHQVRLEDFPEFFMERTTR